MVSFANLKAAGRLVWDFLPYARHPHSLEQSMALVRDQLARREDHFLNWLRAHVYSNPANPYAQLLDHAGCALQDIEALVKANGLEAALQRLRDDGVYLTYEEFKGRSEAVRGSRRFQFRESDFNNPGVRAYLTARSSGSSGARVGSPLDVRLTLYEAAMQSVVEAAHGTALAPHLLWLGVPPDTWGMNRLLRAGLVGIPIAERWFTPTPLPPRGSLADAGLWGLRLLGQLSGHRYPRPEHVPADQAAIVADCLAEAARTANPVLNTTVSGALEVVKAASGAGLDLRGVVFEIAGEPLTAARAAQITGAGSRIMETYWASEVGRLGISCPNGPATDDLHLLDDKVALITHRRIFNGLPVEPFLFTSLHPQARKLLLNVETDDTGGLERRSCGCLIETLGFGMHLSQIRSFGKLTAQGRNILGSDMLSILEEVLPQRFGGSPVDYQLIESEAPDGSACLTLRVSPDVAGLDEESVIATVLQELHKGRPSYTVTADVWRRAETLKVERKRPEITGFGKVLPLHIAGAGSSAGSEPAPGRAEPGP